MIKTENKMKTNETETGFEKEREMSYEIEHVDTTYYPRGGTIEHYTVTKSDGTVYHVQLDRDEDFDNSCSCPAFKYKKTCKHLGMVEAWIAEVEEW